MDNIDLLKFILNKEPSRLIPQVINFDIKNFYIYYTQKSEYKYKTININKFDLSDLDYDFNSNFVANYTTSKNDLFKIKNNYSFLKVYEVFKEIIKVICENKRIKTRSVAYFDFNVIRLMNAIFLNVSKDIYIRDYLKYFKNIDKDDLLNYVFIIFSSNDLRDECNSFLRENDFNLYLELKEKLDKEIIYQKYDFLYILKNVDLDLLKHNIKNINNPDCHVLTDL